MGKGTGGDLYIICGMDGWIVNGPVKSATWQGRRVAPLNSPGKRDFKDELYKFFPKIKQT